MVCEITIQFILHDFNFLRLHAPTLLQRMSKNVFNFTLKYIPNTPATQKRFLRCSIAQSSACSFCLQAKTLPYIVFCCKLYLERGRYTCEHDSALTFIAKAFSTLHRCSLYFDLPTVLSSSHGLILITKNNILYIKSIVSIKLLHIIICNKLYIQTITKLDLLNFHLEPSALLDLSLNRY